jgi:rare lipoprotein A
MPEITPKIEPTTAPIAPEWHQKGKASYYSVDGCLGCRDDLKMANGEKFEDLAFTLANNHIALNTNVLVENTRNGQKAIAKVTDRGGFEKYGRVADLSIGLATAIGLKTDADIITITIIK